MEGYEVTSLTSHFKINMVIWLINVIFLFLFLLWSFNRNHIVAAVVMLANIVAVMKHLSSSPTPEGNL